jgi:starch synthase
MRALHVCSEIFPILKTGGLADVAAGLPPALIALGCDVRMLVPGFPAMCAGIANRRLVAMLPGRFGAPAIGLTLGQLPNGIQTYVIEAEGLYDRPGNPYADADNVAYADNDRRFGLLGWIAMRLAQGLDPAWQPQVVHCHDWHAGMAPAYLKAARDAGEPSRVATVMTVHNLAYQGVFSAASLPGLGLPDAFFAVDGVEFHGQLSFLKAGLYYADAITTVSPTYAREIQEPAQGCGLHGLLHSRRRDLHGILNGVDDAVWNPVTDPGIAARFDSDAMAGKALCRQALQAETGLAPDAAALVFGVVSRLTEQKGLNLVLDGIGEILSRGGQLVLLGTGDAWLQDAFRAIANEHPRQVAIEIGYDEDKAHRIIAGCDVLLVPSHFEPCGLTQMYALGYGTLPLVRRVGGLADTVADCTLENLDDGTATGFVFERFETDDFVGALRRAFALQARPARWRQVQRCGMRQSFTWDASAAKMLALYEQVIN